jgi:hypothetical protein
MGDNGNRGFGITLEFVEVGTEYRNNYVTTPKTDNPSLRALPLSFSSLDHVKLVCRARQHYVDST